MCTVIGTGVLNPSEHQFTLGYKYLEEGKYKEAIIAFNKVIKIDNKKIDAYLGKSQAEIGLKDSKRKEVLPKLRTRGFGGSGFLRKLRQQILKWK